VWRAKAAESGDANSPGVLASCGRTCSSPVVYQTVFWKTAEGKEALFSLTTGEDNTALGFRMIRNRVCNHLWRKYYENQVRIS